MKKVKYKKMYIVFFAIFLVVAIGLKLWEYKYADTVVTLKGQELNVIIAKNPRQKYKGLSGRESLGIYDGMIFPYAYPKKVGIVMRDMLFPIDIIWIEDGAVVDIAAGIEPQQVEKEEDLDVYLPRVDASIVIELKAGWSETNGLKIGDKLGLPGN